MAITRLHPTAEAEPPLEAYPYGWRYVPFRAADGRIDYHQIPLTLEDVLHPQEGDQVMETVPHERHRRYLADVLTARLADDPSAVVLSDTLVEWGPATRGHSPDIAVILGVRAHKNWRRFEVPVEGVRPSLIIELTSPGTASLDRRRKVRHYQRMGVAQYVIVDGVRGRQLVPPRLVNYRLVEGVYQRQAPDSRGWVWLEVARLWLGVVNGEPVCFDEAGQPLGDYQAQVRGRAEAEQARVQAEQARAEAEQARAEAEQARAQAEQARAQAEQARAQAEQGAAAERAARAALERRLRSLEEELRRRD